MSSSPNADRLRQGALAACALGAIFLTCIAVAQSDPEAVFNQAVDAYKHNQFTLAVQQFQQVSGAHTQEAQQYIQKMKTYREAIDVAKSEIDRSPGERDANSLDYAIQRLEQAIQIKPDGPWDPNGLLSRARDLRAQFEKKNGERGNSLAIDLCAKSVSAAEEHRYTEAAHFICAVANDNPGYQCGGDDAIHLCQVDRELAKIEVTKTEATKAEKSPSLPTTAGAAPAVHSPSLDNAIAAYDKNDFEKAQPLFQHVDANSKSIADAYLDKISRYNDALSNGEKLGHEGEYDRARASFLSAAGIKPDGPGDPQSRASSMELFLGVDRFYSGDYISAIQALKDCSQSNVRQQPLIHFYLGASELARFFVTGAEDNALHQNALNDFKVAKQGGFKAVEDISPKILRVYNDL